jgi:hypothetical protein
VEWILILIAVHSKDPNDIPAYVTVGFPSQQRCLSALNTIQYEIKFKSFKVEAQCVEKSSSSQTIPQIR